MAKDGSGASRGLVTATGISCGSDCSESYAAGASVTLTAWIAGWGSTAQYYRFSRWAGAPTCTTASTCTVTMDQARSVTATFGRR